MPISRPSTTRAEVPSHWPAAVRSAPGGATAGVFLTVGAELAEGVASPYGSFFSSRSTSASSFSQSFALSSTTLVLSCLGPPIRVREDIASSAMRSEEHTSELQSLAYLVCRLLLEKKKTKNDNLK